MAVWVSIGYLRIDLGIVPYWYGDPFTKFLVMVSRPGDQGLGPGLEFLSKVSITSLGMTVGQSPE